MVIKCLPKLVKSEMIPYLRGKGKYYKKKDDNKLADELYNLADVIQNRIALCTPGGNPSGSWLRRKGFSKEDLMLIGNIMQVVDDNGR